MVPLGGIGGSDDTGESGDKLNGLQHQMLNGIILRCIVIVVQGKHAAGQYVHNIAAGDLEDHILKKTVGQRPGFGEDHVKACLLFSSGQFAHQQQIGHLFKAKGTVFLVSVGNIVYIYAPIIEMPGYGSLFPVVQIVALNGTDLRDTD